MKALIRKGTADGFTVRIPPSKSLSHRALIVSALADGTSKIIHPADNRDMKATIRCLRQLGARIHEEGDHCIVEGIGGSDRYDGSLIDCSESGSTLRFLIPVFAMTGKPSLFTGQGRLMDRPLDVYADLFGKQSLPFEMKDRILHLQGPLSPGEFSLRGDISSQFITGLLLTLPLLPGDSVIRITEPYESRSYVALTEDVLQDAGITFHDHGLTIGIPGGQKYHGRTYTVDGDDSQAAFFLCLACLTHQSADVLSLRHDSHQPDHRIIDILRTMGAEIMEIEDGYRIIPHELHGCTIDLADCPDLGPVLFALAAAAEGTSVFVNAGRLRYKESDRIAALEEELRKLGCDISSDETTVTVHGGAELHGTELDGHGDHRVVMSLSVLAASMQEPVMIKGCEAADKSYPGFLEDLRSTGTEVTMYDR
ncbi:MAG: 3-phosphoshikimate 1-carboxyvinyltransferase [Solobacterium sp.]|nr:3-phosphoshikimate 1-carboxyvinyltransferase [Solobacterium sp.]